MKVDRSKFLVLAGALSASAAAALVTVACTTTSSGTDAPLDGGGGGDDTDAALTDGGDEGDDAGDGGDAGVVACLGDTVEIDGGGDTFDCAALQENACDFACEGVNTNFRKAVALGINECLLGLPSCEGEMAAVEACVGAAMENACEDTTVVEACTPLVDACNSAGTADAGSTVFDKSTCEAAMRALSTDGRQALVDCVTEGVEDNCTASPGFCIEVLRMY